MSMSEVEPKGDGLDPVRKERRSRKRRRSSKGIHGVSQFSTEKVWNSDVVKETKSSAWDAFDDLERIDSTVDEESGAFSDFNPISLDDTTNATEDHDTIL